MRRSIMLILLLLAVRSVTAEEHRLIWHHDLAEGKRVANQQGKDLLINFTGDGWCYNCTLLDRKVLSQPAFAAVAVDFVLVELKYPAGDGANDAELAELSKQWKHDYLVRGVPTVVLADAGGRPYAYTGYEAGITAGSFATQLKAFQKARAKRDAAIALAQKSAGTERARHLNAAIQAVAASLGLIEQAGDDPVLYFYSNIVEEIRQLDQENSARIREIYDARIDARDALIRRETVLDELEEFNRTKNWAGAVRHIDDKLPQVNDEEIRWRLEIARHVYLEWDNKHDCALGNARRLMLQPSITSAHHRFFRGREIFDLFRAGRNEEAIEACDRLIADSVDSPDGYLEALESKAQLLHSNGTPAQSIDAWNALRAAALRDSEYWENSTELLAMQLAKNARHPEAIALQRELLAHFKDSEPAGTTRILLAMAESLKACGTVGEAREALAQARASLQALVVGHASEQELQSLEQRLEKLETELQSTRNAADM